MICELVLAEGLLFLAKVDIKLIMPPKSPPPFNPLISLDICPVSTWLPDIELSNGKTLFKSIGEP